MKRENIKSGTKRKIYWFIAIVSLIYGGILLFLFLSLSYLTYVKSQFAAASLQFGNVSFSSGVARHAIRFKSISQIVLTLTFLGSLIALSAGVSLLRLLRTKETKELKRDVIESMIMPDEKNVITELERNNGELTQSDLVRKTKLSKVKVHRIVKRLESLGIVSKYPYGVTNKIKLEKILEE